MILPMQTFQTSSSFQIGDFLCQMWFSLFKIKFSGCLFRKVLVSPAEIVMELCITHKLLNSSASIGKELLY